VAQSGEPIAVVDIRTDPSVPPHLRAINQAEGIHSLISVPIKLGDVVFGVFNVHSTEPRVFTTDEQRRLLGLATRAALAIENARLFTQSERRRRDMEALYRADELLHRSLQLQDVLRAICIVVTDILGADKTSVLVWDERHERMVIGAGRGYSDETLAKLTFLPGEGIAGKVAVTGKPLFVEDARNDPRTAARINAITAPEEVVSYICVPIVVRGEVFGVFSVNYRQPQKFSDEDLRPLEALAQRAAVAVQNAELYERAQQVAVLEERQRLARELHDAVTQTLFSASLIAEVLPKLWDRDPSQVRHRLDELRRLSRGALAEMRTLLFELRPAALAEASLVDLIRQLVEATSSRGAVLVELTLSGDPRPLPAEVNVGLYRLTQEALNNVCKHAEARQAWVKLAYGRGRVELVVRDDGRGFDPDPALIPAGHFGLGIMRERAELLGAKLRVDSRVGAGTTVRIAWRQSGIAAPGPR
jgi:signal transduction histidine kinase